MKIYQSRERNENKSKIDINLARMTVVLHTNKIAPGKRVHIYLLQKGTRTVAISFECLPVFRKKLDIQLILQLSRCLSVTNISKHNMFSMCDFC